MVVYVISYENDKKKNCAEQQNMAHFEVKNSFRLYKTRFTLVLKKEVLPGLFRTTF